ncbi:MAG: hypothetical protein NW206_17745 [Hyphomonadaceae bacterium]|nr:hypothetical protein [Hyphomonadaceae bacterium]
MIDETSIQSELSPVESGDSVRMVAERSIFKLLLTGQDDSAIATIMKQRDFKTSRTAKLEVVNDMLRAVEEELAADYPHADDLEDQSGRLEGTLATLKEQIDAARSSVRGLLDEKRAAANAILAARARLTEISINLGRFEQLAEVYVSDIQRLESLEEAGFLLLIGSDRDCPLCGAEPDQQKHDHGITAIEAARKAALAEIGKIRQQERGLATTVAQLTAEQTSLTESLERQDETLKRVESDLARLAPDSETSQKKLDELLQVRDQVKYGLELLARRKSLLERQAEFSAMKRTSEPKPQLGPQSSVTHEFAQTVASVLRTWHFPGKLVVVFDDGAFDIKIDGKHRRDNGKGVRAILHAAFKVGLLLHCHEKSLPHPGFLVLDSPLVTYRDPMNSKAGPLTNDEAALRATTLKQHFFDRLDVAQRFDLVTCRAHQLVGLAVPPGLRCGMFSDEGNVARVAIIDAAFAVLLLQQRFVFARGEIKPRHARAFPLMGNEALKTRPGWLPDSFSSRRAALRAMRESPNRRWSSMRTKQAHVGDARKGLCASPRRQW